METIFFRYPRLTILSLGLILVAGLASLNSLPRQEDPALTERFGYVITRLPGGSAERVEALITEKIENGLQEIEEIKHLASRSQTGLSTVRIQLEDSVTEVDEIWSRIRSKVAEVKPKLPESATTPDVLRNTTAAFTLLFGFTWEVDDRIQMDILHRLAKELKQRVISLAGTKEVTIYGEPVEEIVVSLDSAVMASARLTADDISRAIAKADPKISAGRLQGEQTDLIIEVAGQLDSVNRIRNIPLRPGTGGNILRVGDIAKVEKKVLEPPSTMAIIHGKPGIVVAAKMETSRRVDRWAAAARQIFQEFLLTVPKGIKAQILFDQSFHTDERLQSLAENLLFGAAIVVAVLFVMMGWRSALLVATALPLTTLMVFPALKAMGVPLHQISLTGLIIALGLLIDNAIVSVDGYTKARLKGHDRLESISLIVRHLFGPLLASTATTVLTFLPLAIMPGNAGEFVSTLGISVILSIVFSLLISLTLILALTAFFDGAEKLLPQRSFLRTGLSHERTLKAYERLVNAILHKPWWGIAVGIFLPLIGFGVAPQLVQQFFPTVDRSQFQIQMTLPPQVSIYETKRNIDRLRDVLRSHPEVVNSVFFLGERPPRVWYNVTIFEDGSPNFAGGFVNTKSAEDTQKLLPRLQRELMQIFPNAEVLSLPYEQGPPVEAPIEVRVYGPNLDTLQRLGESIRLLMSETRKITYTRASISGGRPKLHFVPSELKASLAGLTLLDLARQLNASLDGSIGGFVLEGTEELPVRVRVDRADRIDLGRIATQRMRSPGAVASSADEASQGAPLNALARVELVPQVNLITRRDGEHVNTIQGFVEPFILPSKVLGEFRRRLSRSGFQMPAGYRLEYGGETEGSSEARASLIGVFGPLLVLMVGTVVLAFNSFLYAAVIGLVAILSIGAALLSLWVFGYPMGFMAVIGTMGLIGLGINDSIVILSELKDDQEARAGNLAVISEVVVEATRHIISTTLTTVGGFVPLVIWGGLFWPPLAIVICGGLIASTLLALFLIPAIFVLLVRRQLRKTEKRRIRAIARGRIAASPAA